MKNTWLAREQQLDQSCCLAEVMFMISNLWAKTLSEFVSASSYRRRYLQYAMSTKTSRSMESINDSSVSAGETFMPFLSV